MFILGLTALWQSTITPSGKIADAERVLRPGQVYECVTPPIKIDNDEGWDWYAIVEVENKYFGLKFSSQPALKGVVAKQEGTIVFIRLASDPGVTIPNPLSSESQTE